MKDIKALFEKLGVNVNVLGNAKAGSAERKAEALKLKDVINKGEVTRSAIYGYVNKHDGLALSNVTFSKYLSDDENKKPVASFTPAEDTGVRSGDDSMQYVPEGGRVFDKAQVYFFEALLEICSQGEGKKAQLAKDMVNQRIQREIIAAAQEQAQKALSSLSFTLPNKSKERTEEESAFIDRMKAIICNGSGEYEIDSADLARLYVLKDAGLGDARELLDIHEGAEASPEAPESVKAKK